MKFNALAFVLLFMLSTEMIDDVYLLSHFLKLRLWIGSRDSHLQRYQSERTGVYSFSVNQHTEKFHFFYLIFLNHFVLLNKLKQAQEVCFGGDCHLVIVSPCMGQSKKDNN